LVPPEPVAERDTFRGTIPLEGVAVKEQEKPAGATVTVTFVHGEQLLFSSDSVITPAEAEFVLSAQALIEPSAVKGTEGEVAVAEAPSSRALMVEEVRSVVAPPPLGAVAFWKK